MTLNVSVRLFDDSEIGYNSFADEQKLNDELARLVTTGLVWTKTNPAIGDLNDEGDQIEPEQAVYPIGSVKCFVIRELP